MMVEWVSNKWLNRTGKVERACEIAYVKKSPGLNVSMSCSVSFPRNLVAARRPSPVAKPSAQAVIPSQQNSI